MIKNNTVSNNFQAWAKCPTTALGMGALEDHSMKYLTELSAGLITIEYDQMYFQAGAACHA